MFSNPFFWIAAAIIAVAALLMAWLMHDDEQPKPSPYWLEPPPRE